MLRTSRAAKAQDSSCTGVYPIFAEEFAPSGGGITDCIGRIDPLPSHDGKPLERGSAVRSGRGQRSISHKKSIKKVPRCVQVFASIGVTLPTTCAGVGRGRRSLWHTRPTMSLNLFQLPVPQSRPCWNVMRSALPGAHSAPASSRRASALRTPSRHGAPPGQPFLALRSRPSMQISAPPAMCAAATDMRDVTVRGWLHTLHQPLPAYVRWRWRNTWAAKTSVCMRCRSIASEENMKPPQSLLISSRCISALALFAALWSHAARADLIVAPHPNFDATAIDTLFLLGTPGASGLVSSRMSGIPMSDAKGIPGRRGQRPLDDLGPAPPGMETCLTVPWLQTCRPRVPTGAGGTADQIEATLLNGYSNVMLFTFARKDVLFRISTS